MLTNLQLVIERGEKIDTLRDRAGTININSSQIKKGTKKMNRGFFGRCWGSVTECGSKPCSGPADSRGLTDEEMIEV